MLKRLGKLDLAIIIAVVAVVLVGGYLGYRMWANNYELRNASPAGREIEALKAELRKKPNNLDLRMRLAQSLSVAGLSDEAVEQYKAILKVNKEFVPALSGVGFELMKQKDWKNGEAYFQRVVQLTEGKTPLTNSDNPLETAYYYIGSARFEQRDYQGAAGYLKRALSMKKDSSDTAYMLAVCYKQLNIMDGYRDTLLYTLQFDPKMPEANYDYGMYLLSKGDLAGAAEHLRTSSDAAPYKAEPRDELAKLGPADKRLADARDLASKDASAALVQARIAAAVDPSSTDALLLVAKLYEQRKDKDKAQSIYEKILLGDPKNAEAAAGLKRVKHGS